MSKNAKPCKFLNQKADACSGHEDLCVDCGRPARIAAEAAEMAEVMGLSEMAAKEVLRAKLAVWSSREAFSECLDAVCEGGDATEMFYHIIGHVTDGLVAKALAAIRENEGGEK